MHLERRWKRHNYALVQAGRTDVFERILQGRRVIQEYNAGRPPEAHSWPRRSEGARGDAEDWVSQFFSAARSTLGKGALGHNQGNLLC